MPPRVAQSSDNKAEGIGAGTGGERLGELTTRKLRLPLKEILDGFAHVCSLSLTVLCG